MAGSDVGLWRQGPTRLRHGARPFADVEYVMIMIMIMAMVMNDDGHNGVAELDADEINQHDAFLPVHAVTLHGRGEVMSVHKSLTPRPVGSLGAFVMTQVIQNHFWFVLLF